MPILQIDQKMLATLREYIPAARTYLEDAQPRERVDGSPFGVDMSTIRSFRGFKLLFPAGPLRRYNEWAAEYLPQAEAARPFARRDDFEEWYGNVLRLLDEHFKGNLATHHRHKLADLFVKWCARYDGIDREVRRGIVQFGHCPLDSKSLKALGLLAPGTVLNRNPSMADITSEPAYLFAQLVVQEAAEAIPCTPLEFDVVAWNLLRKF